MQAYRDSIRLTFDGQLTTLAPADVNAMLDAIERKLLAGIDKARQINDGLTVCASYDRRNAAPCTF